MARLLSQTLTRTLSQSHYHAHKPASLLFNRAKSSRSGNNKGELIELELTHPESDSDSPIRSIEEVIHKVIVKKSAPDWLPFVPGASYWVPPFRKPLGIVELFGRGDLMKGEIGMMTEEESLSFSSVRGWPSSAYFVEGGPPHPVKNKLRKITFQTDDEES